MCLGGKQSLGKGEREIGVLLILLCLYPKVTHLSELNFTTSKLTFPHLGEGEREYFTVTTFNGISLQKMENEKDYPGYVPNPPMYLPNQIL